MAIKYCVHELSEHEEVGEILFKFDYPEVAIDIVQQLKDKYSCRDYIVVVRDE